MVGTSRDAGAPSAGAACGSRGAVARMEARGLTKAMIAPGKRVQLVGYPRKDGTPEMRIERISAEGKTVELR